MTTPMIPCYTCGQGAGTAALGFGLVMGLLSLAGVDSFGGLRRHRHPRSSGSKRFLSQLFIFHSLLNQILKIHTLQPLSFEQPIGD